jgi:kinesin family member 1
VSSRAHAIFELHITQKYESGGAEMALKSKVCMVDLAGSERAGQQELKGARMTEGNNINKSLSQLMLCIQFLVKQSKADMKAAQEGKKGGAPKLAIPFRDSKLTWLLKESLSGNARTHMLTTVSPAAVNYEDTLSTLRYASSAKNIKTMSHIEESPLERRVRELNEEVERLRADLVKFQSKDASQSGGGARLHDKMTTNLVSLQAQLDSEKQLNNELGTHWSKSRAEAEEDENDFDLLNSELGVVPPSPSTSARLRKAAALSDSTEKAKEDPDAKNAVYYLSNLNEDEALSGRWKVPLIRKLRVGRRVCQALTSEEKANGVRYLEVGTGGTDLELDHCTLNVSQDG